MKAQTFVTQLLSLGVELSISGGRLNYKAPEAVLTSALRDEIARREAEIVEYLREAGDSSGAIRSTQYRDFAGWERDRLSEDILEAELDFWKQQLDEGCSIIFTRRQLLIEWNEMTARLDEEARIRGYRVEMEDTAQPARDGSKPFVAPRTPAEEVVAAILGAALGADYMGIHENFFDLGGHSLLAMRVVLRLREIFRIEIPLRCLFERPTVDAMVNVIAQMWEGREIVEEIAWRFMQIEQLSEGEVKMMLAREEEIDCA